MCKFLDKSSVAQFLDRSLKGRLYFPYQRHNSAQRQTQQHLLQSIASLGIFLLPRSLHRNDDLAGVCVNDGH